MTSETQAYADRGWYLAVEFRQSSSPKFERAVKVASKHPGFAVLIDEDGVCVYRTIYRPEQLEKLPRLLALVLGWKETRLYLRGQEVALPAIESWLPCFLRYHQAAEPVCRVAPRPGAPAVSIGCYWAGVSLRPSDWDGWYRQGEFDGQGVFHIHKERLLSRVDSWEQSYAGCPFADAALLRRTVAALPDTIDPREDRRWRVARGPYDDPILIPAGAASYADFLCECLGLRGGK